MASPAMSPEVASATQEVLMCSDVRKLSLEQRNGLIHLLRIIHAGLAASPPDAVERPQLLYCLALGQFKLGELIDARRRATELVAANPKDPKAQALKRDIEDALERDGAVGIAIVAGGFAAAAALVGFGLARLRR